MKQHVADLATTVVMMLVVGPLLREGSRARLLVGSCVAPLLPVFSTDESETGEDAAVLLLGCGQPRARGPQDGHARRHHHQVQVQGNLHMVFCVHCGLAK
jgi:hypothetical protein